MRITDTLLVTKTTRTHIFCNSQNTQIKLYLDINMYQEIDHKLVNTLITKEIC